MLTSFWICLKCKRKTEKMVLSKERYSPTIEELIQSEKNIFEDINHEILLCPCGEKHTWFTLQKITKGN